MESPDRAKTAPSEKSLEARLRQVECELQALYEGTTEGILAVNCETKQFIRANQVMCDLLDYTMEELLARTVSDIHPPNRQSEVLAIFDALQHGWKHSSRGVPFLRKDGQVVFLDVGMSRLDGSDQPMLIGYFHDVTEQNHTLELLRKSEERYRLIADNVNDVIWTSTIALTDSEKKLAEKDVPAVVDALMDRWRFSFLNPVIKQFLGYRLDRVDALAFRELMTPESYARIRDAVIRKFKWDPSREHDSDWNRPLELELQASDGATHWCEVVSSYIRDEDGFPTSIMGITRDITERKKAEDALRESESKLRNLFVHLPDLVFIVDREVVIHFANRGLPAIKLEDLLGECGYNYLVPEHRRKCDDVVEQAFRTGMPQSVEVLDMFGSWWSLRIVSLRGEGHPEHAMVIATDITQERLAKDAVDKEQRLLRRLLDLHERERRVMAYDIHDGFAQQLTGAMFRMQGFRDMLSKNPEKAWDDFDMALKLVVRSIDETRRLISGLRPPILDEAGIIEAIEYLVCEQMKQTGIEIEFLHDMTSQRLAPPLENALFRIVQETLQNACRHSRADRVLIQLKICGSMVQFDIQDWGVGFCPKNVEEQHFGLQGIRERARLLNGHVEIDSTPGQGTRVVVELPMVPLRED